MRDRMRRQPEDDRRRDTPGAPQPGDGDGGDGINELRAEADELLDAASAAIGRALSGNSNDFLHNVRQSGGQ